jgi:Holliday junction resolvase-like predicted endonuclease
LLQHGEVPCRFDAVLIDGDRLEWLRAAFTAD